MTQTVEATIQEAHTIGYGNIQLYHDGNTSQRARFNAFMASAHDNPELLEAITHLEQAFSKAFNEYVEDNQEAA